jgi:hypothetical protein
MDCELGRTSRCESSGIWTTTVNQTVSPRQIPIELRDEFVYEYIGEVVSQTSFLKRMQQYADEGIQHFYFMMLQKEEVIESLAHNALTTGIDAPRTL